MGRANSETLTRPRPLAGPGTFLCRMGIAGIVALGVTLWSCRQTPVIHQKDDILVGAHYYMWYPHNFTKGHLRGKLKPEQKPALDLYNSEEIRTLEQHIAWCKQYGIDFLAVDWWPQGSESAGRLDQTLLKAANIRDIKFCVFLETQTLGFKPRYETTAFNEQVTRKFVEELTAMGRQLFHHPSYLRVAGRPVLMVYLTRTFSGNFRQAIQEARVRLKEQGHDVFLVGDEIFWRVNPVVPDGKAPYPLVEDPQPERIHCFDAITAYNLYEPRMSAHHGYAATNSFIRDVARLYDRYRRAAGDRVCLIPCVTPGFNDRGVRLAEDHFVQPRQWDPTAAEGSFFAESIERIALPFLDPKLNMVLITSWNEWNEDTGIEPLQMSPITTRDTSASGFDYTQGYRYAGHGFRYLEIVREKLGGTPPGN